MPHTKDRSQISASELEKLRKNICHSRQEGDLPAKCREDIPVLPEEFQLTRYGSQFLIFDSGVGDPQRMFIFASEHSIRFLAGCDHWYADGMANVMEKSSLVSWLNFHFK